MEKRALMTMRADRMHEIKEMRDQSETGEKREIKRSRLNEATRRIGRKRKKEEAERVNYE